ncbi:hypothetical protein ACA910_007866 [Epithemia clementina (nom. ined.)]
MMVMRRSYSLAAVAMPLLAACLTTGKIQRTLADAPSINVTTNPTASTNTSPETEFKGVARAKYEPKETCPFFGCPLFPADVHYNTDAVKAILKRMRTIPAEQVDENILKGDPQSKGWNRRDAVSLTLIGYKGGPLLHQINQDRAIVVSPFLVSSSVETSFGQNTGSASETGSGAVATSATNRPPTKEDRILLGVFDGHGARGELVSEFTVQNLPSFLARKLAHLPTLAEDRKVATIQALHDTFVELDELAPADPSGGSTATAILRQDDSIYIANAGDSRSFVVAYRPSTRKVQILYISREDKPDLPDERARVEAMGGQVYIPKRGTSRVVYQDPMTGTPSGLAMSRSIGDWAAAKLGVIPDPIVDVLDISDLVQTVLRNEVVEQCYVVDEHGEVDRNACNDRLAGLVDDVHIFGVAATDGMMDYLSPQDVAKVLASSLFDRGASHPVSACELLIFSAANSWQQDKQGRYRDDISIAVSVLRRPPETHQSQRQQNGRRSQ